VIHDALLADVHAQPVGLVTVADPVVGLELTDWLIGEIAYVQAAAACETENVWPPIVIVPERVDALGFAATSNAIVLLPLPLVAPTSVIHVALLAAVQLHPSAAVTLVELDPPPAAAAKVVGARDTVHGAPACVTLKSCPAIVSDPLRCVVVVLAAML
jgi:hypothetical protein